MADKLVIGTIEVCSLPELGIRGIQVRMDTGAKTSSLHVDNITPTHKDGKPWVTFDIHPDIYNVKKLVQASAQIHDVRTVRSSNGTSEERFVIRTPFQLGDDTWPIEITLTNRSEMSFLMLFGREGMGDRVLIDPSARYLVSYQS